MSKEITAGIIGAAGYTGGETIRLLLGHPHVALKFVQSRSQAGKLVSDVHPDLLGDTTLKFTAVTEAVDVLFLCMGHGESKKWLAENPLPAATRIVDLGNDFRLGDTAQGREFVYGLPEWQREKIRLAHSIANPGCFATAIQLTLLPLVHARLAGEAHVTGITGSTGAGQKLQDTTHFTWRANNISAYKTLTHQHLGEIRRSLSHLQPNLGGIHFIPWRGDFTRGIFVSTILKTAQSLEQNRELFRTYYQLHAFTHVADRMVDLKQVVNTNKCLLFLEQEGEQLVIHAVLDNLVKGASGQAVQNMNLMFGFDESAGLGLKGVGY
jgi:N-acetyl-gamma-glutamyl-phosphate reductase